MIKRLTNYTISTSLSSNHRPITSLPRMQAPAEGQTAACSANVLCLLFLVFVSLAHTADLAL